MCVCVCVCVYFILYFNSIKIESIWIYFPLKLEPNQLVYTPSLEQKSLIWSS